MDTILMIAGALEAAIKSTEEFNDTLKDLNIAGAPASSIYYYRELIDLKTEKSGSHEKREVIVPEE